MNLYYNLSPEQRLVQRLTTLFNADEQLWQRLKGKRRLRRRILPRLSPKLQKHNLTCSTLAEHARRKPM